MPTRFPTLKWVVQHVPCVAAVGQCPCTIMTLQTLNSAGKYCLHVSVLYHVQGMHWDTRTYGKHHTKNLKFLVHQRRPNKGMNWDTGTYGKHQTENFEFLVH